LTETNNFIIVYQLLKFGVCCVQSEYFT